MRGINDSIEIVFDIIKMKFDLGIQSSLPSNFFDTRYISGDNLEKRWLSHSKFLSRTAQSQQIKFAIVEFNSDLYFVLVGLDDPDFLPTGLIEEKVNAGIFTAIIAEFELPIREGITNLHLEQNILSQSVGQTLYTGHDVEDLKKIFPNIYLMKITSSFSGDSSNIHQLISHTITINSKYIFLPFTQKTLDKIRELITYNSTILSYESITQALFASHFKFAFLDLYRCIELLFQIIYLDETHTKLSLTIDRTVFLIAIEDDLGWKPKERTSLVKIFNDTPSTNIVAIKKAIREAAPGVSNYGNWLYDLRCNIVHLKSIQRKFELKDKDWEQIICGTSDLLCFWYNKYPSFT
jgi:hypothetical protein